MLNPIAEPNALSSQLGFLNPSATEEFTLGQTNADTKFSAQLQALMQGRQASQGQFGLLAQAKALNVMNDAALEQLAQKFSLELDLQGGESVFDQLSTWMAEQGLATGFAFGATKQEKIATEAIALQLASEEISTDALEGVFAGLAEPVSNLLEDVKTNQQAVDGVLNHDVAAIDAALVTSDVSNPMQLDVESAADHFTNVNLPLNSSIAIENDGVSSNISSYVAPVTGVGEDAVLAADQFASEQDSSLSNLVDEAVVASMSDVNNIVTDTDSEKLPDLESHALELPVDTLVSQDVPVNGFAQEAVLSPVDQSAAIKLANSQNVSQADQLAIDAMTEETVEVSINVAQSFVQVSQSSAPGLVANPQQTLMQRQAQVQANPQAPHASVSSAASVSDEMVLGEAVAKSAADANGRVLTPQQQVFQNAAQQQILNLNNREMQALQQQGVLKASDMKLVNMDESTEAELLVTTPVTGERKASSPFLASISYPLRHPQWSQSVGKRIVFMANQQMQQAQIRLNPEHLGPIQVRLHMDRDQMVSVSMTAQHGTTREALEAAIPRLKEMLTEAGIDFDSVTVEDDRQFASFEGDDNARSNAGKQNGVGVGESVEDESVQTKKSTDNMIDFYA